MNWYTLFKELRHHRRLADRRDFNFEQNRTAKFLIWLVAAIMFIYLAGFAVLLAFIANTERSMTSIELICGISPFMLTLDFFLRFTAQQTPTQLVKPYVLFPIPRYACIDHFIASSLFTMGNLIWFAMLIPYTLMSIVFSYGIFSAIGTLLFLGLLILMNSQWYAIVRTLINDHLSWWILPIIVYALIYSPWFLCSKVSAANVLDTYSIMGTAIEEHQWGLYMIPLFLLIALVLINRKIQHVHVWKELSRTESTRLRTFNQLAFLDRYGETGHYLQLEIKTILRNKNPRKSFIFASAIVLLISLIISFTDIYEGPYMTNWWCLYNFVVYGAMMLVRIMCNEGNYIDCLMVHKENILSLLRAKYLFYTLILLFPFTLMLPTVLTGKWPLSMLLAYAAFTAGFQYFVLFQMAVYNKQAIPLNTKFISKGGIENNYFQLAAEMVNMLVPVAFVSLLQLFMNRALSYLVMFIIGVAFISTNRIWLRNIYNRFMRRRYENMEAFRGSRSD